MKRIVSLLTLSLLCAANLSACSEPENGMSSIQEQTEKRFQLNPHPKQAYRIKIKINDAPGPLKLMQDMTIRYMARNCSYIINKFEGASTEPTKRISTKLHQIGQNEYETVVYFDAMQDENYFGQGVCQWQPDGFGTSFKATGKPEETTFNVSDLMEHLTEKKALTKYYLKDRYPFPITRQYDYTDFGSGSIDDFSAKNQKNLFTITVSLEEIKS
ncbi:MAG: hypothetical protein Q4A84_08495 [Neisseria sp.]|uniref:hypothetical protein n=1 Tax=Neisseria sp. TaxID=192066 RepID=UPI0026DC861A|nr:hypothetical protein [Neisseria sp.]MDO4641718.1 hypothetical protein [Neisseria sp.]